VCDESHQIRSNSKLEMEHNKLKIAVLAGGIGSEREISLQSGRCVAEALKEAGFEVVTADIRPDNLEILNDVSIDLFFPALHGKLIDRFSMSAAGRKQAKPHLTKWRANSYSSRPASLHPRLLSSAPRPISACLKNSCGALITNTL